ncbi:unknown [Tropheryma whipplei str. Twist]|uniref:Transglycosylase SLT domain-containing protein n=2 Tax=Tropheryma whipplei TaxID=2039 RepID=Q83G77_TROWT|nr:unknown [Tropheryma whipplei str. Twist]CAD66998.1 putative secreted protein [Tropheryma whipplei TW08/27]
MMRSIRYKSLAWRLPRRELRKKEALRKRRGWPVRVAVATFTMTLLSGTPSGAYAFDDVYRSAWQGFENLQDLKKEGQTLALGGYFVSPHAQDSRAYTSRPLGSFSVLYKPVATSEIQSWALERVYASGWDYRQFTCLVLLWNKESGWNPYAMNRYSGAYGIPQALPGNKMKVAGDDWRTNPKTQVSWGLRYISARFGNPCGAWEHSVRKGWY